MSELSAHPHPEKVVCPGGPLLLRGHHVVRDPDGQEHRTTRPVSAVCLCGHSAAQPWCDGTHKIARRRHRTTTFGELTIAYDERVLEPRPWTAAQSRWVADLLATAPPGPVLELCTGAGQIGLLALHGHPGRDLVLVDLDEVACSFALLNAEAAGMGERVSARCGDLSTVVADQESFAAIIADPPWVPTAEVGSFPEDPRRAIDGGDTGLDLIWGCLDVIADHLAPGGLAVLQVGPGTQADLVREHLEQRSERGLRFEARQEHPRGVLVQLSRPEAG